MDFSERVAGEKEQSYTRRCVRLFFFPCYTFTKIHDSRVCHCGFEFVSYDRTGIWVCVANRKSLFAAFLSPAVERSCVRGAISSDSRSNSLPRTFCGGTQSRLGKAFLSSCNVKARGFSAVDKER